MSGKTIGIIVLVIIVLAGLIWYISGPAVTEPAPTSANTAQSAPTIATASSTENEAMVTYTDSGFSPVTITIAQGQTVMWMNDSSSNLWVASDPHPTHQGYDGTTLSEHCAQGYAGPAPFDECTSIPPGGSWSFTFGKVGTWAYHNHMDPSVQGSVTVTGASSSPQTGADASTTTSATVTF